MEKYIDFFKYENMIEGFLTQTLIDFPSKISSILFTFGCNFRCPYCYNLSCLFPEYRNKNKESLLEYMSEYFYSAYIETNFLDGIVITGGEPTIWKDKLVELINDLYSYFKYYKKDIAIKLDTNGTNLDIIKKVEDKIDYIAMDIKLHNLKMYNKITNIKDIDYVIFNTVKYIINNYGKKDNKNYEFRITLYPDFFEEDLNIISDNLSKLLEGSKNVYLQQFINTYDMIDKEAKNKVPLENNKIIKLKERLKNYVENIDIRFYR